MVVAVIGGPIASGKSSLSRAAATRLEETGKTKAAVIDLDVIYEMLDPQGRSGRPKSDERTLVSSATNCRSTRSLLPSRSRGVVAGE